MTSENTQIKNLNFGDAIAHLKNGYCVAREGWNGKGMFLFLVQGSNTLRFTDFTHIGLDKENLVRQLKYLGYAHLIISHFLQLSITHLKNSFDKRYVKLL